MATESDPNPSEKQLEVLRYIIAHIETHGFQPSQSEVAQAIGVTKNAIQGRLKELARRGIIDLPAGNRERAIVLKYIQFRAISTNADKPEPGTLTMRLRGVEKGLLRDGS